MLKRLKNLGFRQYLKDSCKVYLGSELRCVSPIRKNPEILRLHLENQQTAIFVDRGSPQRNALESITLDALSLYSKHVPQLLVFDGRHALHEDMPGETLQKFLKPIADNDWDAPLSYAIQALLDAQDAARRSGLQRNPDIPHLGNTEQWYLSLLSRPYIVGEALGSIPPPLELQDTVDVIQHVTPALVKWRSHLDQALLDENNHLSWTGWQFAGIRDPLDDFVWLLGDEAIPDIPGVEQWLIDQYLADFAIEKNQAQASEYFYTFGTLHLCTRMETLLAIQARDGDSVDFKEQLIRLAKRGQRWSAQTPTLHCLTKWFHSLQTEIDK